MNLTNANENKSIIKLIIGIFLIIIYTGSLIIGPSNYSTYYDVLLYVLENSLGIILGIMLIIRGRNSSSIIKKMYIAIAIVWLVIVASQNIYKFVLFNLEKQIPVLILHLFFVGYLVFSLYCDIKGLLRKNNKVKKQPQ